MTDYDRIARAIDFIVDRAAAQPQLDEIAAHVHLSPFHFQRLFSRWAGITPKRFLQVLTVERAKPLLAQGRLSLLDASESLGLSSSSRLHDHFVSLEAMTPDEYRRDGQDVEIVHGEADSPFGRAFIATTPRGLCAVSFVDHETGDDALDCLANRWPGAVLRQDDAVAGELADRIFRRAPDPTQSLTVAVQGTNFQIAVWRALLRIPAGNLVSYGDIAAAIGRPAAVRAVGTAVGANPCAFVIPCHRVIRESGALGGYRWGLTRKHAIHAWEAAGAGGMLSEC